MKRSLYNELAADDLNCYLGEFPELRLGQFLAIALREKWPHFVCPKLFYINDGELIDLMNSLVKKLRDEVS